MALLLLFPAILLGFAGVVLFFYFFTSVPLPDEIGGRGTLLYDATGAELATLQPEASREDVELGQLPEHVVHAVLAAEDAQFYSHAGISLPGIFRAAFVNVTSGRVTQGGSTISQQYIKNVTTDDARTALRKVREAALAVKLEQQFSKDEILEFYLNSIYFGRGAYGIQAAAMAYYDVDAADLSAAEAVQLAAIIPSPSRLDPFDNPEGAERRYRYVLDQMLSAGTITATQAGVLAADMPEASPKRSVQFREAPFFLDMVQRDLAARVGEDLMYRGLEVTTTLDLGVQAAAEAAYREHLVAQAPGDATGAMVAMDPATGGIRALVGGEDHAEDQLNLALQPRQPGSTFKPFALAAWVEQGKSPDSYFPAPAEFVMPGRRADGSEYKIANYGGMSFDDMSLREATWRSVNTVYGQVLEEVGAEPMVDIARRAGIDSPLEADASTVLGSYEVTPLELAEAYNTFATGGIHREPITIERVERDGETIFQAPMRENEVMSQQVAWTVSDVLQGVLTSGTARRASIGRPAAGKTGTTSEYGDAWFAGYTPQLTAVVWMGNRDNRQTMPGEPTGGGLPAEVWRAFMSTVHDSLEVVRFPAPAGSLRIVRPSPSPEPTTPTCDADEVLSASGDECVTPEPTEEPTDAPVDEPTDEPAPPGGESPAPEPTDAPAPSPEPPAPTASPSPQPGPPSEPSPEPSPTAEDAPTEPERDEATGPLRG